MANEIQKITLSASPQSGVYRIEFDGQETGDISYADNAATIQSSLEALSNIGSGNVSVDVSGLEITITFTGSLGNSSQPEITVSSNTLCRNTVETLSLNGQPSTGSVGAKENASPALYASLDYSITALTVESQLESAGYPASLSVSGDWFNTGWTFTTSADVTLNLQSGGDFLDAESNPLTLTYAKTQSYSSVSATPSTVQEGSAAAASSSSVNISLLGVG